MLDATVTVRRGSNISFPQHRDIYAEHSYLGNEQQSAK